MARRKKIEWNDGDLFAIILSDSSFVLGQVLDTPRPNQVRVALFNERADKIELLSKNYLNSTEHLITAIMVTREQLDYGVWKIIGNSTSRPIPVSLYPNEEFRNNEWIGSTTHDASILESFAEAYFALDYWNMFFDPEYFNKMLYNSAKKPNKLIYKEK